MHSIRAALGIGMLAVVLAACGTPQSAATLVSLGLKAQLSGDLTTAEDNYQQAIKLDANNVLAHYDLGTVDDRNGKTSLAVGEYTAALVIDPTFSDALFNLAVDTTAADPLSAKALYMKVVSQTPTFAAAWLNLGFILQSEGNATQARADWTKAVALEPSFATRVPSATPPAAATPKP
jgi:tetratricopeptide (TPR) repeat protein